MYASGDYDLAGFCVGIVEKSAIIDGSAVQAGDVLIGLASSGPHSNGYSLIRKIIEVSGSSLTDLLEGRSLADGCWRRPGSTSSRCCRSAADSRCTPWPTSPAAG